MSQKGPSVTRATFLQAVTLLAVAVTLTAKTVSADSNIPPGKYLLADVVFELTDSSPMLGDSSTVRVGGNGRGVLVEHNPRLPERTSEFAVDPKDVFKLLELCYWSRFFELQSRYGPPETPRLNASGEIEIGETIVADAGGRVIRVRIGSYSKTVSYLDAFSPPPILIEIAKSIDAMRSKPPAK